MSDRLLVVWDVVQCAVFLPVIATLIITSKRTGFLHGLTYLSYARYALEAYVLANAERLVAQHSFSF